MRKDYFINAEHNEKRNLHSGGFLQNIISFITDNKDLIGANVNIVSSAY